MKRKIVLWAMLCLLLLALAGSVAADIQPRIFRLDRGGVMWAECEGGSLPITVLDGPGQSVGLWCGGEK